MTAMLTEIELVGYPMILAGAVALWVLTRRPRAAVGDGLARRLLAGNVRRAP